VEAAERWHTAQMLEPGGERRWELTVSLPEP
jgi:hypothetical protein